MPVPSRQQSSANYAIRIAANERLERDIAELLICLVGRPTQAVASGKGFLTWVPKPKFQSKRRVLRDEIAIQPRSCLSCCCWACSSFVSAAIQHHQPGKFGRSFVYTFPNAINNSGQVVGTAENADGSLTTPFRTEPNSPINPLTDNLVSCRVWARPPARPPAFAILVKSPETPLPRLPDFRVPFSPLHCVPTPAIRL